MLCYAGCVLLVLLACRRVIDSFRWGLFEGFARDDEAGVWSIIFFFLVWSGLEWQFRLWWCVVMPRDMFDVR